MRCAEVDDGDRVIATERVYGTFVVATLRGLEACAQLDEASIPNLERTLQAMADFPEALDARNVPYGRVVRGYGKKLFGDRTNEQREQMWRALGNDGNGHE